MSGHKKTEDNKEPQKRDYPGYKSMKALFRLVRDVVRPQMRSLQSRGLGKPVALRGALSAPATGHTQSPDFYYVASLPEAGLKGIKLPRDSQVEVVAQSAVRITFNDEAGRCIEVLAVPAASRRGINDIIRDEPGAFGVAVDTRGTVYCTEAFKTTAALNPATRRTASLPTLRQGRLAVGAVCVQ